MTVATHPLNDPPCRVTDPASDPDAGVDPAWLGSAAWRELGRRRVRVFGAGLLVETVRGEVATAVREHGGSLLPPDTSEPADLKLRCDEEWFDPAGSFEISRTAGRTLVRSADGAGLLYGLHHVLRQGEAPLTGDDRPARRQAPEQTIRMLDHWDNIDVHEVMGQVERGYAGDSIFYDNGRVRDDLTRVQAYARLLGSVGINHVCINNVNVHRTEATLITDLLPDVARIAAAFRPHGIRIHLAVSFAAPVTLGGLATADPVDPAVGHWWATVAAEVYEAIPDFGGFVVKADSEGQPGPFGYGRTHAEGANMLARALAPFGGTLHWRAFVYNHHQDWRDRSTDRARAAHDHFVPLDGEFDDNVILQVKSGPMDFQVREPVSPLIAAMPRTRLAVELQVTQEYTGQQRHACYLAPQWSQILRFPLWGDGGATVADVAAGRAAAGSGGLAAVSNVGDDPFWTGHPLAQANLFAFGRLAWDSRLDPIALLDEWIGLTFDGADAPAPDGRGTVRQVVHRILDGSWQTYEDYTAPLGIGFMVTPGSHYGPSVDGYEYSPWGTYHFADRDGIGVDRTVATGSGYAGQYPQPWLDVYEDVRSCPDELLLFFHHVGYGHVLHSGSTVLQHIYDTHFAGQAQARAMAEDWAELRGRVPDEFFERVSQRLAEQVRSATEWRDQLTTYFLRKAGVPDAQGRPIYP